MQTEIVVFNRTQAATDIRQRSKRVANDIIQIGKLLIEAKAALDHGEYLPFVEVDCRLSPRMAQHFVNVADRFSKSETATLLPLAVLYALASPSAPESAADEIMQIAEQQGHVSKEQAKAIIQEHKVAETTIREITPVDMPVDKAQVQSIVNVFREVAATGALDPGTGEMLPFSQAIKSAVTEETYERTQRQQDHIADNSNWDRVETCELPAGKVATKLMDLNIDPSEIIKISIYKRKVVQS